MQITIGKTVLAGKGSEGASELRHASNFNDQVAEYVRAESIDIFDRGNTSNRFTFDVWREHKDIEEAGAFIVDHAMALDVVDLVTFVMGGATGGATKRFARGRCKIAAARQLGRSTFHSYDLLVGKLAKSESEVPAPV